MKKIIIPLCGSLLVVVFACEAPSPKKESAGSGTTEAPSTYTARDGHTIGINVTLNNGAKWEANLETTQGIATMQGLMGEFPNNPTTEDYRALHRKLTTKFQGILQQCTMTGEAHNQLHNYLLPLKEMIDKLGSENLETCNTLRPEIEAYLMKYSHFFYS